MTAEFSYSADPKSFFNDLLFSVSNWLPACNGVDLGSVDGQAMAKIDPSETF